MEEAKTHNLKKPPASQAGKKQTGARQTANQPAQGARISRRSSKTLTGQKPKSQIGVRKDIKTPTAKFEPYDLSPYADIDDCYSVYKMNKHQQLTPFSNIMEFPYDFKSPIYDYMQVVDRTEVEGKGSRCKKVRHSKQQQLASDLRWIWDYDVQINPKLVLEKQREIIPSAAQVCKKIGKLKSILFQPRNLTKKSELLIFNFEGVIGDYFKLWLTDNLRPGLYLRPDTFQTLKELQVNYQIVIVSTARTSKLLRLLTILSFKAIYISGAYKLVAPGQLDCQDGTIRGTEWFLDYGQIMKEFKTSPDRTLIISFSSLPFNELERENMVYEKTGGLYPTFFVNRAPIPTRELQELPVTLLFPHPRANEAVLSFNILPEAISMLASPGNFYKGYKSFFTNEKFESDEISEFYWKMISPPIKAEDLEGQTCPLHERIIPYGKKTFPVNQFILLKDGTWGEYEFWETERWTNVSGYINLMAYSLNEKLS